MRLRVTRDAIQILPDSAVDEAYIEEVLGLRNDGDAVRLVRRNAYRLSSIAYVQTEADLAADQAGAGALLDTPRAHGPARRRRVSNRATSVTPPGARGTGDRTARGGTA